MEPNRKSAVEAIPMLIGSMLLAVVAGRVLLPLLDPGSFLQVGDIVEFDATPYATGSGVKSVDATVTGNPGSSCVLDAAAIGRGGGSLLVTRVRAGQDYDVHWNSGAPTSGLADCGRDAWLTLSVENLVGLYSFADRANGAAVTRDGDPTGSVVTYPADATAPQRVGSK